MSEPRKTFTDLAPPPRQPGDSNAAHVDSGAAILDRLHRLQDSHRLAMHMWEEHGPNFYTFPTTCNSWFQDRQESAPENDPYGIQSGLAKGYEYKFEVTPTTLWSKIPCISMSLLPAKYDHDDRSKLVMDGAIRPFSACYNDTLMPAYLVNFDQSQPHPPRVLHASRKNLQSDNSPYHKHFDLVDIQRESGVDALDTFYRQFDSVDGLFKALADSERGGKLTEQQLDALGKSYEGLHTEEKYFDAKDKIAFHNEIIAAAAKPNIEAIMMPCMLDNEPNYWGDLSKLTGALAGLQHLARGMDLPVVYYHVTPPHTVGGNKEAGAAHINAIECAEQNRFTLIGKGRAQLTEVAVAAIRELRDKIAGFSEKKRADFEFTYEWDGLCKSMKDTLDIDIQADDHVFDLQAQKALAEARKSQLGG